MWGRARYAVSLEPPRQFRSSCKLCELLKIAWWDIMLTALANGLCGQWAKEQPNTARIHFTHSLSPLTLLTTTDGLSGSYDGGKIGKRRV